MGLAGQAVEIGSARGEKRPWGADRRPSLAVTMPESAWTSPQRGQLFLSRTWEQVLHVPAWGTRESLLTRGKSLRLLLLCPDGNPCLEGASQEPGFQSPGAQVMHCHCLRREEAPSSAVLLAKDPRLPLLKRQRSRASHLIPGVLLNGRF